jgi:hypothetical protein
MTERIRQLGPNPLKLAKLAAAKQPVGADDIEDESDFRRRK